MRKIRAGIVIFFLFAFGLTAYCTSQPAAPADKAPQPSPKKGRPPEGGANHKNEFDVTGAAFSPDGKYVVVSFALFGGGSYHGPKWKMWDIQTGKEVRTNWPNFDVKEKHENSYFISYLPGGKQILTYDNPGVWRIWDAEKITRVGEPRLEGRPISISADRKKVLVANSKTEIRLYDSVTGECSLKMDPRVYGNTGTLSPDHRWAIVASDGPPVSYLDLKEKRIVYHSDINSEKNEAEKKKETLRPLMFSPDGKTVLVQKIKDREYTGAVLCDIETLKVRAEIPGTTFIVAAAFTPDSERLVLLEGGFPRQMRCWDLKTKQEMWRVADGVRKPIGVNRILMAPSGDTALLINAHFPGEMALISTKTGKTAFVTHADFPQRGNFSAPEQKEP